MRPVFRGVLLSGLGAMLCMGLVFTGERGVGRTGKADSARDRSNVVSDVSTRPVHPNQVQQVTREQVLDLLDAGSFEQHAGLMAKADSLIEHANNLMAKGRDAEAMVAAQQVLHLGLPNTTAGNALLGEANLLLGGYFAQQPGQLAAKGGGYFEMAASLLDPSNGDAIGEAFRQAADIYRSVGRVQDANRVTRLAQGGAQNFAMAGNAAVTMRQELEGAGCDTAVAATEGTSAQAVGVGESVWFSLDVTSPSAYEFQTSGCAPADTLFVCDSEFNFYDGCTDPLDNSANLIASDGDSGDSFQSLLTTDCLAPGTYYLEVFGWLDSSSWAGDLSVTNLGSCFVPLPDEFEWDNEVGGSAIGCDTLAADDDDMTDDGSGKSGGSDDSCGSGGSGSEGSGGSNGCVEETVCELLQTQCRTITAGDIDFAVFNVGDENRRVRVATAPNAECGGEYDEFDVDTVMAITDQFGGIIAVNDDDPAGGTFSSAIEFCAPANTDFNAVIFGFSAASQFSYELSVDASTPCTLETEPNGICEQADDIGSLAAGEDVVTGGFYTPYTDPFLDPFQILPDVDWYIFTNTEECDLFVGTDATDNGRSDMQLSFYVANDPCGQDADLLVGGAEAGIIGLLPPGTWLVSVTAGDEFLVAEGAPAPYDLIVDCGLPPIPEVEPNDTFGMGMPLDLGQPITGNVNQVDDFVDFFNLTLLADTQVTCDAGSSAGGDTVLELFDNAAQNLICCDDDSSTGFTSLFSVCLPPGDYTIGVTGWNGGSGADPYTIDCFDDGPCTADPDPANAVCDDDGDPYSQCPFGL